MEEDVLRVAALGIELNSNSGLVLASVLGNRSGRNLSNAKPRAFSSHEDHVFSESGVMTRALYACVWGEGMDEGVGVSLLVLFLAGCQPH